MPTPTPNKPGPGRPSSINFLIDAEGRVIGYRNPLTKENVYDLWFTGSGGGGGGSGQTWDAGATWDGGTFWS